MVQGLTLTPDVKNNASDMKYSKTPSMVNTLKPARGKSGVINMSNDQNIKIELHDDGEAGVPKDC